MSRRTTLVMLLLLVAFIWSPIGVGQVSANVIASSDGFVIDEPLEDICDQSTGPNCSGQKLGHGETDPIIAPKAKVWTTGSKRTQKVRVHGNNRLSTEKIAYEPTLVVYLNEDGEGDVNNLQPLAVVFPKKAINVKPGKVKRMVAAKVRKTKGGYYVLRPGKRFELYSLAAGYPEKIRRIDLYGDEVLAAYVVAADAPLIWGGTCYSPVSEVSAMRCKSPRPWLGLTS